MTKSAAIDLSDAILKLQVFAERIHLLGNDLYNDYFSFNAEERGKPYLLNGVEYDFSRVKVELIIDMAHELETQLNEMQNTI